MNEVSIAGSQGCLGTHGARTRRAERPWLAAVALGAALSIQACGGGGGSGTDGGDDGSAGVGAGMGAGTAGWWAGTGGGGSGAGGEAGSREDSGTPPGGAFTLVDDGLKCYGDSEPTTTVRVGRDCWLRVSAMYEEEFSEPISLTVEGLPPGVSHEVRHIYEGGLTPNTSSSVDLFVRGIAEAGTHEFIVKGTTSSHGSATLTFSMTITSLPGFELASVDAGYHFACGLDDGGQGYCWGDNSDGQLGIGTVGLDDGDYKRLVPTAIEGGLVLSKIFAGPERACAIDVDGKAYCWGSGWLGDGMLGRRSGTPILVAGGLTFADIAIASTVTCGVTTAGAVYCWGGSNGNLGNGTWDGGPVPTPIASNLTFKSVKAGYFLVCALETSGGVWCWGDNSHGQLGFGEPSQILEPTKVDTSMTFKELAAGFGALCGLTDEGSAYCWGRNAAGELGIGEPDIEQHHEPELVAGGLTFTSLVGKSDGFCGLDADGYAYCWSFAGTEGTTAVAEPTPLRGGVKFSQVSVGSDQSCGIAINGLSATYCWRHGSGNSDGYLGTGDTRDYSGPVPIAAPDASQ